MSKVGRNAPCPCRSGLKFKKCHGRALDAATPTKPTPQTLPPQVMAELDRRIEAQFHRHQAREQQRLQMQGRGNPIVSIEHADHRLVAVGNRLHWSKSWRTFEDFLLDYIKKVIGPEWGTSELQRPEGERHPLLNWYTRVTAFQRARMTGPPGTLYRADMNGVVKAYLHLAYDLYLIAHNAALQEELLRRLRDPTLFEAAVHEAHVVGIFAKAGFKIELEDETDNTRKHCEFVATHQETGKVFAVEAKAFTTASGRSSDLTRTPSVRTKLKDALTKITPHQRIVVIELARAERISPPEQPAWVADLNAEMIETETDLIVRKKPAPPAYVFVTNRSCVWAEEGPASVDFMLAYGFKIPDFLPHAPVPLLEAVKARRHHAEMFDLMQSFAQSSNIPSSFDERLPEETFLPVDDVQRLRLGERYIVPDADGAEKTGVLVDAVVLDAEKAIAGVYRLDDGRDIICRTPISDEEMSIYKASPSTFFGVIRNVPKGLETVMDLFDFLHQKFGTWSKDQLLQRMATWPEPERRTEMTQAELADFLCAAQAAHMWSTMQKTPAA